MVGEKVGFGGFGPMPVGTPSQVADVMEKWFAEADIDGFNIQCKCPFMWSAFKLLTPSPDMCNPESIEDLVELLIPELQKRGLYRTEYPVVGGTFRENMQGRPGQPLLGPDHPGAKVRWNATENPIIETKFANGTNGAMRERPMNRNGVESKVTNGAKRVKLNIGKSVKTKSVINIIEVTKGNGLANGHT